MEKTFCAISLSLFFAARAFAQGTIIWDESVNGALSQDFGNPTALTPFGPGTNTIIGKTEVVPTPPNWAGYPDFFKMSVPSNMRVSAIFLTVDKPNVWTWLGNPEFSSETAFIESPVSGQLLAQWGLPSIGSGDYGMYLNNHDQQSVTSIANYRLDFFLESVPEPSALPLALAGAAALVAWLRNKRQ